MCHRIVYGITLHLFLFSMISAAENPPLVFATLTYPPYAYNEDGQKKGIDIEIMKDIAKMMDRELEIKFLPNKRQLKPLYNGEATLAFAPWYSEANEKQPPVSLTPMPIYSMRSYIFALQNWNIPISTKEDLSHYRVGHLNELSFLEHHFLPRKGRKVKVNSPQQLHKLLVAGRIDTVALDASSFYYHAKLFQPDAFKPVYPFEPIPIHAIWSQAWLSKHGPEAQHQFSAALSQLKTQGRIEALIKHYDTTDHFTDYQ
jgi:polar amino acid transport system substrate-binding protein